MRRDEIVAGGVYARYNHVHRYTHYRVIVAEATPPTWYEGACDSVKYVQGGRKRDGTRKELQTGWCTRRAMAAWATVRYETGATGIADDFGLGGHMDVRDLAAKLAEEYGT